MTKFILSKEEVGMKATFEEFKNNKEKRGWPDKDIMKFDYDNGSLKFDVMPQEIIIGVDSRISADIGKIGVCSIKNGAKISVDSCYIQNQVNFSTFFVDEESQLTITDPVDDRVDLVPASIMLNPGAQLILDVSCSLKNNIYSHKDGYLKNIGKQQVVIEAQKFLTLSHLFTAWCFDLFSNIIAVEYMGNDNQSNKVGQSYYFSNSMIGEMDEALFSKATIQYKKDGYGEYDLLKYLPLEKNNEEKINETIEKLVINDADTIIHENVEIIGDENNLEGSAE